MTIVLDTNLWVSMLLGMRVRGLRRHLYDPRIHVVTSSEQRAELTTTLSKPKLTTVLTLTRCCRRRRDPVWPAQIGIRT